MKMNEIQIYSIRTVSYTDYKGRRTNTTRKFTELLYKHRDKNNMYKLVEKQSWLWAKNFVACLEKYNTIKNIVVSENLKQHKHHTIIG